MDIEVLIPILAALVSMAAGGVASAPEIQRLFRRIFKIQQNNQVSYAERLADLTKKLQDSSIEVDEILKEMGDVADSRQKSVEHLERSLSLLEKKENSVKDRISALERTPLEAATHFASLISDGEKKGAKRDYMLFGAGVLLSTMVAISIQFFVG